MEDLIKQDQLKEDRRRVNKFTAERMARQNKDNLQEKLEDLFLMYLDKRNYGVGICGIPVIL